LWMRPEEVSEQFQKRIELLEGEEEQDEEDSPEEHGCSCGMACSKTNNSLPEDEPTEV